MRWALVNASGRITSIGYSSVAPKQESFAGMSDKVILGIPPEIEETTHYYDWKKQSFIEIPVSPGSDYFYDYETKSWKADVTLIELKARGKRNQLLSNSDWTQLPDVPLATKESWAVYRQALRDITNQPGFPLSITWPNKENY